MWEDSYSLIFNAPSTSFPPKPKLEYFSSEGSCSDSSDYQKFLLDEENLGCTSDSDQNVENVAKKGDIDENIQDLVHSDDILSDDEIEDILSTLHSKPRSPQKNALSVITNICSICKSKQPEEEVPKKKRKRKVTRKSIISSVEFDMTFNAILTEVQSQMQEKYLVTLNATAEMKKITKWISELTSAELSELKKHLHPILTKTTESKVVEKTNHLIRNRSEIAKICQQLTDNVPAQSKVCGINMLIRRIVEQACAKEKIPQIDVTAQVEESPDTLMYVIGSVIRSISRKSKRGLEISSKMHTKKENVAQDLRKWIEAQDRGGLLYPNEDAYKFFVEIYKLVCKFYGKVHIDQRAILAKEKIKNNEGVMQMWKKICDGKEDGEILDKCVQVFINTIANGHVKKLREDLKSKIRSKALQSKSDSKARLRKKLQQENYPSRK